MRNLIVSALREDHYSPVFGTEFRDEWSSTFATPLCLPCSEINCCRVLWDCARRHL